MPSFDITEDVVFDLTGRGATGTSTTATSGVAWDCSVGGLPFLYATSNQYPMRRETADFRRQRVDSQRDVGEQSLDSGYWIRSQSSWHYGAGLTSAEPLEVNDAEARFRFATSGGVDVWTPGELSLLKDTEKIITDTGASPVLIGVDSGVLYGQGTDLTYQPSTGSSAAVTWGGSGNIYSITSTGSQYVVADNDKIYKGTLPSGAGSAIYEVASNALVRWVKQRLMVAEGASLHEVTDLSPSGAPAALPTALYVHPNASWTWTDFAEGPANIFAAGYAGDTSTIFNITVTSSTTAIELDQPVVVAELPRGELVRSLYSYLGSFLIVGTSKGVRVAAIQNNGSLSMGPLIVEITGGCTDAVAVDRFVYVTGAAATTAGNRVSRAGLYRIDLGQPLESAQLRYAYAADLTAPAGTTGSATQVTVAGGKLWFAVDGAGLFREKSTYVTEGWLETGRIRLGTLEPKAWRDIRLILKPGSQGSTEAYAANRNDLAPGTWRKIITADGVNYDVFGSLAPASPNPESDLFVALRLVSNPACSCPARTVGYQVRAVPAPKRSRLLQLVCMLFDFETDRKGLRHGQFGGAYQRLLALEDLENTAGTVLFRDFTTGELAEAYIERLAFQRTAPPTRSNTNAGGVVQIVLRLV